MICIYNITEWLGLSHVKNSYVGDANLKGISGGQKRRLSIGVEVVSGYSILIAELPTNGLDAKTAYGVIECAKDVCKSKKSMIMNLAQPSPELFNLFDNCCIMSYGECIYFGPVTYVENYLLNLGLIKPANKSITAWIEELTVKPKEFINNELRTKFELDNSFTNKAVIRYLAKKFRLSPEFNEVGKEVLWKHLDMVHRDTKELSGITEAIDESERNSMSKDDINNSPTKLDKTEIEKTETVDVTIIKAADDDDDNLFSSQYEKTYDLRGLNHGFLWYLPKLRTPQFQIKQIVKRQMISTFRNKALVGSRIFQALSVGIILGFLFFGLKPNDDDMIRSRIGLLFFVVGFMGFGAVPFIPALSKQLPVFYYQKNAQYFRIYSFYIAQIISEIPFTLVETILFMIPCYFMTNLYLSFECIIVFFMLTFMVRMTSWSFCMFLTSTVGNASIAQNLAALFLPIFYAFNGFLVPSLKSKNLLVKFIGKYLSFFTYPFQELANSQLYNLKRDDIKSGNPNGFASKWIDVYGLEGKFSITTSIQAIMVTIMWFTIFNCLAYGMLMTMDHSEKTQSIFIIKKSIKKILDSITDLLSCGSCKKIKQKKMDQYVQKKIKQYKTSQNPIKNLNINVRNDENNNNSQSKGLYLSFKNVDYTVTFEGKEIQLLHNINGYIKPGEVVALMGPSGAGKSTLLDVLAKKKNTGVINGDIMLNNEPLNKYFNRNMGYVEQFNSHMSCLTVYEAIKFSANLRLPNTMTQKDKDLIVNEVIDALELRNIMGQTIGTDNNGISQEAKKKVTIAVELVSQPGVLFLDEPTTGLDGGAAFNVMNTVRKYANDKNVPVICTIHQPSGEVFELFDKLLLLDFGKTVYFGDLSNVERYFKNNGFGEREFGKNPADFVIESINNVNEPNKIWLQSEEHKNVISSIDSKPDYGKLPEYNSAYASSFINQFNELISRSWKFFIRDRISVIVRMLTGFLMGIMLGMLYFESRNDNKWEKKYQTNMMVSILFVTVVFATESCAQEIPLLISERATFYREIDSKLYSIIPYYLSRFISQLPLLLVETLLFAFTIYPMSQGTMNKFIEYFIGVFSVLATSTTFSQLLAISSPTEGVGNVLYTTLCTMFRLFAGFLIPQKVMKPYSRVISIFNFFKYAFFYLASTILPEWGNNGKQRFQYFREKAIFPKENETQPMFYLGGLLVFWLCFHLISIIVLKFKRWDKR